MAQGRGQNGAIASSEKHQPCSTCAAELFRTSLGVEFGMRAIRQSVYYSRQAQIAGIGRQAALNNIVLHKVLPKLMLDLGRTSGEGKLRRDILLDLRETIVESLDGIDRQAVHESSVDALDQIIAAADRNNGIANYWLR